MYRRIVFLVFFAIVLFVVPFSMSSWLRDRSIRTVAPLTIFLQKQRLAVTNFFLSLDQLDQLRTDKESLQQEVVSLQQQLSDYEQLKRENETLHKELGVTGTARDLPKVFAHIIVPGSDPLDRTFTIDVGKSQGIRVGQPAVSGGYLVGRIIEVRDHSAQVRTILSAQSVVQAWIPTIGDKGLLIGEGNTVSLQKISQGFAVPPGSIVETSGLSSSLDSDILPLPPGILIGTTGTTLSQASDLTQTFRIDIATDPSSLESVMILLTDAS
jgi:rod shape-determining protein MreC